MSNYNIQVGWSGKDALADSDPAKIISGNDFNTEFTAVRTALNSKADLNGNAGEDFACNNLTAASIITASTLSASGSLTFDGNTVGTNATGNKTISSGTPTGGANGDVWFQV